MNATLDSITAQLAECRQILERPGFRVRTFAEHRAATRRDLANTVLESFGGEPIAEPPQGEPSPESKAALAEFLDELRRLEREALALRK